MGRFYAKCIRLSIISLSLFEPARHKLHIIHNDPEAKKAYGAVEAKPETQPRLADTLSLPSTNSFYEVEMILDDNLYEGDLADIRVGSFVSFRYISQGLGPPLNARISYRVNQS